MKQFPSLQQCQTCQFMSYTRANKTCQGKLGLLRGFNGYNLATILTTSHCVMAAIAVKRGEIINLHKHLEKV